MSDIPPHIAQRIARAADERMTNALLGGTCTTAHQSEAKALTIEKLHEMIDRLPPRPRFISWSIMPSERATTVRTKKIDAMIAHPDCWCKAKIALLKAGERLPEIEDADADEKIAKFAREAMLAGMRQIPIYAPVGSPLFDLGATT